MSGNETRIAASARNHYTEWAMQKCKALAAQEDFTSGSFKYEGQTFNFKRTDDGKGVVLEKTSVDYQAPVEEEHYTGMNKRNGTFIEVPDRQIKYLREGNVDMNEPLPEYQTHEPGEAFRYNFASDVAIASRENYERYTADVADLNAYDKKERKAAEKDYKEVVRQGLETQYSHKSAKRLTKLSMRDDRAGEVAAARTVYYDKAEYDKAKDELKAMQKAAKKRVANGTATDADKELLERSVEYISDKTVRKFIASRPDIFAPEGKFDPERYRQFVDDLTSNDNTLTVDEREKNAQIYGLSKSDIKKMVKYQGENYQKSYAKQINIAKTIAGALLPAAAAFAAKNGLKFATDKELLESIKVVADQANGGYYLEFESAEAIAKYTGKLTVDLSKFAMATALLSGGAATLMSLIDAEGYEKKKANGYMAAGNAVGNYFREQGTVDIEAEYIPEEEEIGGGDEEGCGGEEEVCHADLGVIKAQETEVTEDVKNEPSLKRGPNGKVTQCRYWYDYVNAYDYDTSKYTPKDVWHAIQKRNGYTAERPNPPAQVGLPADLELRGGITIKRKETYELPWHNIQRGTGNGKGHAPGAKAGVTKVPGQNKYVVTTCDGQKETVNDEATARRRYQEEAGKPWTGTIPEIK